MKRGTDTVNQRKHWYFITEYYCPLCGRSNVYKERRYDERPADWNARHNIIDAWDYCDA